jgi:hypothetical protein
VAQHDVASPRRLRAVGATPEHTFSRTYYIIRAIFRVKFHRATELCSDSTALQILLPSP